MPATTITRQADARTTTTPNAVMTTLASPTQGGTDELSLWRVHMDANQRGPLHVFDTEQAWTLLDGTATITIDGEEHTLSAGDTVVIAAKAQRQIKATTPLDAIVAGSGSSIVTVPGEDAPRGTPPWVA